MCGAWTYSAEWHCVMDGQIDHARAAMHGRHHGPEWTLTVQHGIASFGLAGITFWNGQIGPEWTLTARHGTASRVDLQCGMELPPGRTD